MSECKTPLVRDAVPEDAPALLEIYRYYVEKTAITFDWEVPTAAEFADRIRSIRRSYPYLVLEQDGRLLGYAYAGTFKNRRAYDWAVETTIYLDQSLRGKCLGRLLYAALEQRLAAMHITNLNACICYNPTPDDTCQNESMRFHTKEGYALVGKFHRCGYKFNRWYDMIWMEKLIGDHPNQMPPVLWPQPGEKE